MEQRIKKSEVYIFDYTRLKEIELKDDTCFDGLLDRYLTSRGTCLVEAKKDENGELTLAYKEMKND